MPAVGDIFECKLFYDVNGQTNINVLHYTLGTYLNGSFTDEELQQEFLAVLNAAGNGAWRGEMSKLTGPSTKIRRLTVQKIYPQRIRAAEATNVTDGTAPFDATTANVGVTITKKGRLANRHNIGSIHLGGVPHTWYEQGKITNDELPLYQDFIDNFLIEEWTFGANEAVMVPSILNKTRVPNSDPPRYVVSGAVYVQSWELQPTLRVMRRRTVGLGI